MDFRETGRSLRARWRLIVALGLLGAVLAGVFAGLSTPKYQATAQLFVAARDSTTNGYDAYAGGLFTQGRVVSYVELITEQSVLQPVVDQLQLPISWQQLSHEVSASSPGNTVLINVAVLDPSASRAQAVANAVAAQFATFVAQLETLGSAGAPVKVSVTQPADLPTSTATPKVALDVAFGLLLGLALGAAIALARGALDTSIKSAEELRTRLALNTLGRIPNDRDTPKHPLVINGAKSVARADAFRQLRTNMQFIDVDRQPRSLLVTSSVVGEGKTTAAANLAVALAQIGVSVILVEADLRRPRLSQYLGLEGAAGLTSVLVGWAPLEEVLQSWGGEETPLRVLSSGPLPPNPSELLATDRMSGLLAELESMADVVVVDGPPLLPVTDSAVLSTLVSGTLLVVRQGRTRRDQIARAVQALRAVDATVFGAVLNRVPRGKRDEYYYAYTYRAADGGAEPPAELPPMSPTPRPRSSTLAGPRG